MMMHPTDDDFVLHIYGETNADEAARIEAHLASCETCAAAWAELQATLALVDRAQVPEPDAGFEQAMWARLQPYVPAPRVKTAWSRWVPLAAAATIVLAAGLVGWHAWRAPRHAATSVATAVATPAGAADARNLRERVLLTALDDHVEQAQLLLVELMNSPETGESDADFARSTASDLVAAGRLYRQTALQNGNTHLAAMLDDLEPVLVDVAHGPDRMGEADWQALRTRIEDGRLLFKMRAAANEIRERQRQTVSASAE